MLIMQVTWIKEGQLQIVFTLCGGPISWKSQLVVVAYAIKEIFMAERFVK